MNIHDFSCCARTVRKDCRRTGVRFRVALQPLQVSFHLGCTLIAQVAILFQSLVDDAFEFDGQIGIQAERGRGSTIQDAVENHARTFAMKRRHASSHFVQARAKREQIGAVVEIFRAHLLRRHVGVGPGRGALLREDRFVRERLRVSGSNRAR